MTPDPDRRQDRLPDRSRANSPISGPAVGRALPYDRPRTAGHRRQSMWTAALIHRVSGVLLALFLPLHFLALGLAINNEARLESFLRWSNQPLVKLAEAGLVALLVVHLVGGIRILVIEMTPWRGNYNFVALVAFAGALVAGIVFLLYAA